MMLLSILLSVCTSQFHFLFLSMKRYPGECFILKGAFFDTLHLFISTAEF